jgi:hypothetical protein
MGLDRYAFFQQAFFVDDLDEAIVEWDRVFGAGSFVRSPHHRCDSFDYRGTDLQADVSYAFGYLGDTMIQFIVQHDDTPSIYRDMYAPGEYGFHHSGILVEDFEAEFERLESLGFTCATRLFADNVDAAYFDTRAVNGGFSEIHGSPPHILEAFASWRRAHDARQPGDSPFLARER